MNTIGERVRHLRQSKGLSMDKLAKKIKIPVRDNSENFKSITSAAISNIENDKGSPSAEITVALSDFFNVSTDWILKGKEFVKRDEEPEQIKYLNLMPHIYKEEDFFNDPLLARAISKEEFDKFMNHTDKVLEAARAITAMREDFDKRFKQMLDLEIENVVVKDGEEDKFHVEFNDDKPRKIIKHKEDV